MIQQAKIDINRLGLYLLSDKEILENAISSSREKELLDIVIKNIDNKELYFTDIANYCNKYGISQTRIAEIYKRILKRIEKRIATLKVKKTQSPVLTVDSILTFSKLSKENRAAFNELLNFFYETSIDTLPLTIRQINLLKIHFKIYKISTLLDNINKVESATWYTGEKIIELKEFISKLKLLPRNQQST